MPAMHVSQRLTRAVQPRAHLRELELDRLERGDGRAEGLALLRVGHRNLEGCLPLRTTGSMSSQAEGKGGKTRRAPESDRGRASRHGNEAAPVGAHDSQGLRGDANPPGVQGRHRELEATSLRAEQLRARDAAAIQDHLSATASLAS